MAIREAQPDDAQAMHALIECLDAETAFMLCEPGERKTTVEQHRERLERFRQSDKDVLLVFDVEAGIGGFVLLIGNGRRRIQHRVHLVIGVAKAHWGQGHGRGLMQAAEAWAREHDMTRISFTVMAHNARAIRLYESLGYEREGILRDSLRVDGTYVDEIAMAKLLD